MKSALLKHWLAGIFILSLAMSCAGPTMPVQQDNVTGYNNQKASETIPPAVNPTDNSSSENPYSALLGTDDYDGAIGQAKAALEGNPEDLVLREKLADAFIARAWYYKVKRLNPYTLSDLMKAAEVAPKYYRAYYELGRFHNNQWQFSIGLLDLNKALSLKPDFAPAYNERGFSNYKNQKYEAALADVDKALELDPLDPRSYCTRSLINVAMGKPGLALEDADKAVRIAPSDAASYYNRSLVYTAAGKPDLAIADLEITLNLSQDDLLTARAAADLQKLKK